MRRLSGFVYLVHADGTDFYKIGVTTGAVESRLSALSTNSPFRLSCVYAAHVDNPHAIERELHSESASVRQNGEWFELRGKCLESVLDRLRQLPPSSTPISKPKHVPGKRTVEFGIGEKHPLFAAYVRAVNEAIPLAGLRRFSSEEIAHGLMVDGLERAEAKLKK